MVKPHEIVILGAGPAGLSTAMFLAKMGISTLVLERETFPRDKICGDALSGKVTEIFNKLDPSLTTELNQNPAFLPSWGVKFYAPNGQALRIPFASKKLNQTQAPGFISKRMDFDYWLYQKAKSYSEISIIEGAHAKNFEKKNGSWEVKTPEGKLLATPKLIIAADGAQSHFAKHIAGINLQSRHYCAGIRAYYKGVENCDAENFIELHFHKNLLPGYFWIFPLPNGLANVGVGMRSDKISSKKINLKAELLRLVSEDPAFKSRFKNAERIGNISGFGLPLGSKKREISGDGFLLTGDAASLIDPFTGEGIGNALLSGMLAAKTAQIALERQNFTASALNTYDQAVYQRLWPELKLSRNLQSLVNYPWLFNFVVKKAQSNAELSEMISGMFEDLDLRDKLRKPGFYFRLIFT